MIYAVFDTNVLVSALITHNVNASTVKVVEAIGNGKVIPLYNDEIVAGKFSDKERRQNQPPTIIIQQ